MKDSIRHHISVASCMMRLSLQGQLEYPTFLISFMLMIAVRYFAGVYILKVLVDQFQPLAGWDFGQLVFLYGLGLLSHGIMIVVSVQSWFIEYYVVNGEFDRMLLRPMNVFYQFTFSNINLIGVFDIITGIIVFGIGCRLVGFAWTLANVTKLGLVIVGATLLRSAFFTIICSVAFWTKRSHPLRLIGNQLLERATLYPLTIYPQVLQTILTFVIPVGFVAFYPATEFLGQTARSSLPLGFAMWTPLVGCLMFAAGQMVFRLGLHRYESAGS